MVTLVIYQLQTTSDFGHALLRVYLNDNYCYQFIRGDYQILINRLIERQQKVTVNIRLPDTKIKATSMSIFSLNKVP